MAAHTENTNHHKPRTFSPPDAPAEAPSYDQVAITPLLPTSRLITLAGQVGPQPAPSGGSGGSSSSSISDSFLAQVRGAHDKIVICLRAAGATPRDIIHVRHYIVQHTGDPAFDGRDLVARGWSPLWVQFLDERAEGHRPPDTVVGVASLATKGLLYEIEAWAVVHG